ncbi:tyrosine-type recombinase/integrase [Planctomycetota bacterium]
MAHVDWIVDGSKFLSKKEAKLLLKTAKGLAETGLLYGHNIPYRDYFIIHLALATGLRVSEIAQLNCGDIYIDEKTSSLIVRKGKGGKKRLVRFNSEFKKHYEEYLKWKQIGNEPVGPDSPLLISSHTGGHMTPRAIEKAFKRVAAKAGLPEHYSIHSLRHTFACELYKASGYNLRLVQKQLGHSNSKTTEVYADVMNPDVTKSLEKMYT